GEKNERRRRTRSFAGLKRCQGDFPPEHRAFRTITFYWIAEIDPSSPSAEPLPFLVCTFFRPFPPFRVAKSRKSLVEKTPQPLTGDACTGGKRRRERIQKKMIKMTVKGRRENADVAEAYKEKIMRYQTFAESQ
ncbi:Uncharacterized protein DBV15_05113, partial [Temnothorax longispinosus]